MRIANFVRASSRDGNFLEQTFSMRIFHCNHCQQLVFFENFQCLKCDRALAYLPDLNIVGSLDAMENGTWRWPLPKPDGTLYRLCENYTKASVCNWAIPASDEHPLCISCRLTRVIPDLTTPANKTAWFQLELAKRRLVHGLHRLGLPLENKTDDPEHGLAFEFLADSVEGDKPKPVLTGHAEGVITINVAEANDAEREKRRLQLHEPYRTLLGHFRHEVGHYYWDRLIRDSKRLEDFRKLFGDDREDYAEALQQHYKNGPPGDWQSRFVSTYASSHAWEDWAESWAHFLHMVDTLETAAACGLSLSPRRPDEPAMDSPTLTFIKNFDQMIEDWFPLTFALNNLNRGMGLADAYPFVLPPPAIDKLRFIYETVMLAK